MAAAAGCVGDRLAPVTAGSDPRPPENATSVASDVADDDPEPPRGIARVTGSVFQRGTGETARLFCHTTCQLIPGQNENASEGWLLDEVRVEHDYAAPLRPVGTTTSFTPTTDDSPAARLGLTDGTDGETAHEWTVRFPGSGDATWNVVFAAEAASTATLTEGDPLVDVRVGVRETPRWGLRGEETTLGVGLQYGQTESE